MNNITENIKKENEKCFLPYEQKIKISFYYIIRNNQL